MSDATRVQQLLDEIFDTERTPEEVCADCPELLARVRLGWQQIRIVQRELDAMFHAVMPVPVMPGLCPSASADPFGLGFCRPRIADSFGGEDQAPADGGGVAPERVECRVLVVTVFQA